MICIYTYPKIGKKKIKCFIARSNYTVLIMKLSSLIDNNSSCLQKTFNISIYNLKQIKSILKSNSYYSFKTIDFIYQSIHRAVFNIAIKQNDRTYNELIKKYEKKCSNIKKKFLYEQVGFTMLEKIKNDFI